MKKSCPQELNSVSKWTVFSSRVLIYIFCTTLFIIAMSNIYLKFEEGYTTTSLRFRNDGSTKKKLPYVSICAFPPLKQRGVKLTQELYDRVAYSQQSIISSNIYKDEKAFDVKSIETIINGRCFTLIPVATIVPFYRGYFNIFKNVSLQFFVHPPGDEYWLNFFQSPAKRTSHLFDLPKLESGIKYLSISLAEKNYIKHSTKTFPCSPDGMDVLKDCVRSKMKTIMTGQCILPGLSTMYDTSGVPLCKNTSDANATITMIKKAFMEFRYEVLGCLVPCNQTLFDMEYTLYHQNSDTVVLNEDTNSISNSKQKDTDLSELIVSFYFRTLAVEEHVETVVYDAINFLAAAGGNLGLLLGFSCLSTLLYFHDLIVKKLLKQ